MGGWVGEGWVKGGWFMKLRKYKKGGGNYAVFYFAGFCFLNFSVMK
jgi:hypothetical protein